MISSVTAAITRSEHVNTTSLDEWGFVLVPRVFSRNQVGRLHQQIMQRLPLGWHQEDGIALVGVYERPEFGFIRDLIDGQPIRSIADAVFADAPEGYRACGPHGIGINRVVGWHKDRLNNQYRRHEKAPLWGPGSAVQGGHRIYKIGLYLDAEGSDYSEREGALRVVPGSHRADCTQIARLPKAASCASSGWPSSSAAPQPTPRRPCTFAPITRGSRRGRGMLSRAC